MCSDTLVTFRELDAKTEGPKQPAGSRYKQMRATGKEIMKSVTVRTRVWQQAVSDTEVRGKK